MDCMIDSESKKGLTPVDPMSSGGSTISDHRDSSNQRVTGTDGDAAGNNETAWEQGIDIGIPGWVIFLVEEQIEKPPAKLEEDLEDTNVGASGNSGNATTPMGHGIDIGMPGCPVFDVQEQTEEPPGKLEADSEDASVTASGNSANTKPPKGHGIDIGMTGCPIFTAEEPPAKPEEDLEDATSRSGSLRNDSHSS